MVAAGVPSYLWGEFMEAANTLRNLTPVSKLSCTPYEKWTGKNETSPNAEFSAAKAFVRLTNSTGVANFSLCVRGDEMEETHLAYEDKQVHKRTENGNGNDV